MLLSYAVKTELPGLSQKAPQRRFNEPAKELRVGAGFSLKTSLEEIRSQAASLAVLPEQALKNNLSVVNDIAETLTSIGKALLQNKKAFDLIKYSISDPSFVSQYQFLGNFVVPHLQAGEIRTIPESSFKKKIAHFQSPHLFLNLLGYKGLKMSFEAVEYTMNDNGSVSMSPVFSVHDKARDINLLISVDNEHLSAGELAFANYISLPGTFKVNYHRPTENKFRAGVTKAYEF